MSDFTQLDKPFRILDLPREVRDEIWRLAIPGRKIPIGASWAQNDDGKLVWSFGCRKIATELLWLLTLRQISQQVRDEVDDAFGRCAKVLIINHSDSYNPLAGSQKIHAAAKLLRNVCDITLATGYMIVRYVGGGRGDAFETDAEIQIGLSKAKKTEAVRWESRLGGTDEDSYTVPSKFKGFCDGHANITEQAIRQALARGAGSFEIITVGLSALSPGMWAVPHEAAKGYRSGLEKHWAAEHLVAWVDGLFKEALSRKTKRRARTRPWRQVLLAEVLQRHPPRQRHHAEGAKAAEHTRTSTLSP
ncbi:hypothetical protein M409DRAFT_54068 [Zasmidium cellare ATCC 36951]|uniref:Uncharacterized protein n=1 Tax=Zasmidium cellare ATCC 36951 TaxID=1080233 RepID=A0A6A6CNZ7_ZASCE|nr:uncharacterized protein M409DRAFT_54068 [Zasmidium cellare ATCC 36951]KAF2167469.1 hypothetical protein M409DRAFT_54068 [Zasmidium cellare ATCC 36951]